MVLSRSHSLTMTTIYESALDYNNEVRSDFDWLLIPTEILYYIFRKLDVQSLRCCFAVNTKWKEVAESVCELQDSWKELAEDGIVNHGVSHHFKSTLSWKQLYFNSLLWNNLPSAAIHKVHEMEKLNSVDIKRIHVYRDKLIVVNSLGVEYYDVQSLTRLRTFSIEYCEDLQETDDIVMLVIKTTSPDYYEVNVYLKASKDELIDVGRCLDSQVTDSLNTLGSACLWRIVGNNGYVIDSRTVLWKCSATYGKLTFNALSRYYGITKVSSMNILTSIHVIKDDVYITLIWGGLLVVSNDMMFRKVNVMDIPTKVWRNNTNNQQPSGRDKFDAVVTTPFGIAFRETSPRNLLHFHYDDPEMTCGLQHGDVVIRGFVDGRVEVKILRNDSKVNLHVKDFDKDAIDPAVFSLEVCELEQKHMLFIATKVKLYTLLVK